MHKHYPRPCNKCNELKEENDYAKRGSQGRASTCKSCINASQRSNGWKMYKGRECGDVEPPYDVAFHRRITQLWKATRTLFSVE